jgi:hypothetical protein
LKAQPRHGTTPAADPSRLIRGRGSRPENETVIVYNEAEETALVSTASPAVFRRLVRLGYVPDPSSGVNEANTVARFVLLKKKISFRSAKTRARRNPTMPFLSQKPRSEGRSGERRTPDRPFPPSSPPAHSCERQTGGKLMQRREWPCPAVSPGSATRPNDLLSARRWPRAHTEHTSVKTLGVSGRLSPSFRALSPGR